MLAGLCSNLPSVSCAAGEGWARNSLRVCAVSAQMMYPYLTYLPAMCGSASYSDQHNSGTHHRR